MMTMPRMRWFLSSPEHLSHTESGARPGRTRTDTTKQCAVFEIGFHLASRSAIAVDDLPVADRVLKFWRELLLRASGDCESERKESERSGEEVFQSRKIQGFIPRGEL